MIYKIAFSKIFKYFRPKFSKFYVKLTYYVSAILNLNSKLSFGYLNVQFSKL
jgi:hypothetical protein